MPRPHEDRERHTLVDHQAGGLPLAFAQDVWCAVEVLHVRADRADAAVASYETLIEKARVQWKGVGQAAVLRSHNHRRVIALVQVEGHDEFRHLTAAWDEHHLLVQKRAVDESRFLTLYQIRASAGEALIDPATTEAYAFEHVPKAPDKARAIVDAAQPAAGFRGLIFLAADDESASAIVYRFEHAEQIDAFRATPEAERILGPRDAQGDTESAMHVIRTFE